MGATNFGNQTIVFKYKNPSTSKSFNNLLHNILPTGVYKGGTLTIVNNTTVRCSIVSVFIADNIEKVAVKCETASEFDLPITTLQNYIVLRLDWISTTNNFIDAINVSEAELRETDIVLGRGVFDGTNLISIDTSVRTIPRSVLDSVDSDQIKESAVIDSKIGVRVIDQDTTISYSNTGLLTNILSWFGKRIKGILGTEHWFSEIPATLTETRGHIDNTTTMHEATPLNEVEKLVIRDSNGDFEARNITVTRIIGTADSLTTSREISLSGDALGSINFDGTEDVSLEVEVVDNSHNHTPDNITDLVEVVVRYSHTVGEFVFNPRNLEPSVLFPAIRVDKASITLNALQYPDLHSALLEEKLELNNITDFPCNAGSNEILLDNTPTNINLLNLLIEDLRVHSNDWESFSYSGWRTITVGESTVSITNIDLASRIITVSGSVTGTTCSIYSYRANSTTVRIPKMDSRSIFSSGTNNASGFRKMDRLQNIIGSAYRISQTWEGQGSTSGAFVKLQGYYAGGTPGSSDAENTGGLGFDASRSARTGTKTEPDSVGSHLYMWAGRVIL